jgi:sec-independent protein translocase protein TatA
MALDPLELVVIVGAIMIFLIWGPNKIPELAKALGRAKNEYQKAASEVEVYTKDAMRLTEVQSSSPPPAPSDKIVDVAQQLGISTVGKTKDEIADEIVAKKSNL